MENGVWKTIKGSRVFVENGQSIDDAFENKKNNDTTIDNKKFDEKYKKLTDEEIELLQQSSDLCYNNLTVLEKEALYEYAMGGYYDVNQYLDDRYEGFKNIDDMIKNIDTSMDKHKLEQDVTAFRGVKKYHYENYNIGDTFEEKIFVSTSLNERIAKTFADDKTDGIISEIKVPKNTKSIYIGNNTHYEFEAELLLHRNIKYKVLDKKEDRIILEVI